MGTTLEPQPLSTSDTRDIGTALTLMVKMRTTSSTIAIVARELALRLVELSFPPDAVHTPGISHVIADKLSRVHAPGGQYTPERAPAREKLINC